jgi:hypothetical protein
MLQVIILKYWKHMAGALIVLTALGVIYNAIYDRGYAAKSVEVEKEVKAQLAVIETNNRRLEQLSKTVADNATALGIQNSQNLAAVLLSVKNKQLYTITVDGKCVPSKDFEDAYRKLLK